MVAKKKKSVKKKVIKKKVSKKKTVKKKASKKKSVKKKVSKKRKTPQQKGSVSKTDFETFKFGVQRLKELGNELNSLDTRGFSKEAQTIRSKLKNVSEIPTIEKKLKELRAKIRGKYKPKKRKGPSTKKVLDEGLDDIQEEITKLRRSRKEDMSDIKEQLKKLKSSKKKPSSLPVDSGVDVLVDTNFNDFLVSVKKSLSDRIKSRESDMDEVLRIDLQKRDLKYKKKAGDLLKDFGKRKKKLEMDFKKKYNQKVESTLHKEVAEKFNKIIRDKLAREKVELGKVYKQQLREHAQMELEKKKQELDSQMQKKKDKFETYKDEEKRKMRNKLVEEAHKKLESELQAKEEFLRKQLNAEYNMKLKKQIQEHEQELKQKKLDLEMEMSRKIKQLLN